jgi:hypothetical protein
MPKQTLLPKYQDQQEEQEAQDLAQREELNQSPSLIHQLLQ